MIGQSLIEAFTSTFFFSLLMMLILTPNQTEGFLDFET